MNYKIVVLRLTPEEDNLLQKAARKEYRSKTSFAKKALIDAIKRILGDKND